LERKRKTLTKKKKNEKSVNGKEREH